MKIVAIRFAISLALVAMLLVFWLPDDGKKAAETTPDMGAETVTVAMPSLREETFLNWNGGSGRKFYLDTIYDYLVYIDPESNALAPGLATDWRIAADGLSVTLQLREDVSFHQGWGALTADDVKFSVLRTIADDSRAGPASTLRQLVAAVEVIDEFAVTIHLRQPDIEFVRGYLTNGQQLPILSRRYVESVGEESANREPIGSGPFQLRAYQPGSSIALQAVDRHWRHTPAFGHLVFLSVPSESTRVAMLRAGEADIAPVGYDSIDKLRQQGLQILSIPRNWSPVIRFGGIVSTNSLLHNPNVPWAKNKVRQALNYAIDKQLIVEAIFHGEAQAAGMDFPAAEWADIPTYPYNPDKARRLLTEAGYPDGFRLSLKTFESSPGADLPLIGEVVAQYWQKIGIDVQVIPVDWTSLRSAIVNGNATDSVWTHRGLPFSNTAVGLQMSTSADSLFATYSDRRSEMLLEDISRALDPKRRRQLIKELGDYLHAQAAAVYIAHANEPFGASARIAAWPRISDHLTNFDQITLNE